MKLWFHIEFLNKGNTWFIENSEKSAWSFRINPSYNNIISYLFIQRYVFEFDELVPHHVNIIHAYISRIHVFTHTCSQLDTYTNIRKCIDIKLLETILPKSNAKENCQSIVILTYDIRVRVLTHSCAHRCVCLYIVYVTLNENGYDLG